MVITCWSTSALRQYLNGNGNNWWASKEDFDIRPNEYAKKGFLTGFNDDFLAAIKPIKVNTALNTVEGYTDSVEATYDRFFPLSLEEMYVTPQLANVEGPYFPYWKERLGRTAFALTGSANIYPNFIYYEINAKTTPQYVRLRSAIGASCSAWHVHTSGCVTAPLTVRFGSPRFVSSLNPTIPGEAR